MTRLLITSDWHLDATTAGVERREDLEAAVERIAVAIREQEIDGFAFLGDLTNPDNPRAWRALEVALRFADGLNAMGVDQLWLAGNHDVVEDGRCSNTLLPIRGAGFRVFDTQCCTTLSGVSVVALPFTPRSHAYDPAEFVKHRPSLETAGSPVLVFSHLHVEGIEPGSESKEFARGREVFLPLEQIAATLPGALIFNGHYHRRQTFREVNVPGSLARLTRGERDNAPGYLVVEV